RAEDRAEIALLDADRPTLSLGNADRRVTQDLADLALEIAHARLARVLRDDRAQRGVGNLRLAGLQAVRLKLAPHQVAPRYLELLVRRVARKRDDLHAVAQRA